ncbi:hypothetical protein CDG77_20100 [Nostoc sp. 'Peltigera membranacea cyanobiont' 213]|uniref:DUF1257 domain-containing protein n=1 Tax=Nostoc sp. 'Peltigera membranacea cyanobiont' 213 TaxID=2014530 RepID=UPI000B959C24|nr:DUF1257 domain-containing protein [Nostoc sp. 'Peltigera membranacea cyanobiont' 213]OYD89150.1 hypothetical protein CDG77_20100 [Nostoc sp. 'Peltigera membranacea cyanobiont' 213]
MSHFSKIAVKFKDQSCLVEALQRLGFYPQVHEQPVNLYGWRGDKREEVAHIVVPRNQISRVSNDLGFWFNGTDYECLISDYDRHNGQALSGFGLGTQFILKLQLHYINLYLPKIASQIGGEVVESTTIGSFTTVRVSLPTQTIRR